MKLSISVLKKSLSFVLAFAVATSALLATSSSIKLSAETQSELEDRLKEIEEEQKAIDKKIAATKNDISKEKENQEAIEEQISATEDYIATLTDLIKDYNGQIESLENEITILEGDIAIQNLRIDAKRQEIDQNIGLFEQRLRAIYLSGNDSVASVVLGATDFFDMLMKIELVKRFADYDNDLINSLLEMKAELESAELELENDKAALEETVETAEMKKADVERLKLDWDSQLADLEELLKSSQRVIRELKEQQESYEENKDELDKEAEETEEKIQEIIRQKQREEYMGDLEPGTFLWPLPGYQTITSPYGTRWGTTHRGIDISGSDVKGAEITAANSGIVIFVNNSCTHNYGKKKSCGCGGGFGNYCIIDHGGGFQTLYGHAEKIIVKEGDKVSTGDVIGYVGSTGYSTGWHLHFEIRVNGERVNPMDYDLKRY